MQRSSDGEPTRVVVVSPVLPYHGIPHAGGLYLSRLQEALVTAGAEVTFLVDGTNEFAVGRPGAPDRVVLLGVPVMKTLHGRVAARAVREVEKGLRPWVANWPRLPFLAHLLMSPAARAAVRRADVIDLQWPETAHLVWWARRLNPRARILATLHDVLSQRWERQAQRPEADAHATARGLRSALRLERGTLRGADDVIVFSEKDRHLLRSGADDRTNIEVVIPPLAPSEGPPPRRPDRYSPSVVFVGLMDRPENGEAALRLVREIWPSVRKRVPRARLRLIGHGATEELETECATAAGVELAGFVHDLAGAYADASACVVPLTLGAGVKFKTVEALIAGVPTVTTSIGAEGVAGPERFAAVVDDPRGIADALVDVLAAPDAAEANARSAQVWALKTFAVANFVKQVARIYSKGG